MPDPVSLKALSDQVWIRYECLYFWKLIIFNCGFTKKGRTYAFQLKENVQELSDLYMEGHLKLPSPSDF